MDIFLIDPTYLKPDALYTILRILRVNEILNFLYNTKNPNSSKSLSLRYTYSEIKKSFDFSRFVYSNFWNLSNDEIPTSYFIDKAIKCAISPIVLDAIENYMNKASCDNKGYNIVIFCNQYYLHRALAQYFYNYMWHKTQSFPYLDFVKIKKIDFKTQLTYLYVNRKRDFEKRYNYEHSIKIIKENYASIGIFGEIEQKVEYKTEYYRDCPFFTELFKRLERYYSPANIDIYLPEQQSYIKECLEKNDIAEIENSKWESEEDEAYREECEREEYGRQEQKDLEEFYEIERRGLFNDDPEAEWNID